MTLLFFGMILWNFKGVFQIRCPAIISRESWGARPATWNTMNELASYVFIHHTYRPDRCYTRDTCSAAVRSIQRFHQDDKGWDDIGYSFLFGDDGNIYKGRGWDKVGAHTRGYNTNGLGFALIGDFTSTLPSTVALNNVKNMIQCGILLGYIKPNYILRGHRDMGSTECPGQRLYDLIKTWPHY